MRAPVLLGIVLIACGCASVQHETAPQRTEPAGAVSVEFRLARRTPAPGFTEHSVPGRAWVVYLSPTAELNERDVQSADVLEGPEIELVFTPTGAKKLADVTTAHIDEILAIVVDGEVVSAPTIRAPIKGGRVRITESFSEREARRIAAALNMSKP